MNATPAKMNPARNTNAPRMPQTHGEDRGPPILLDQAQDNGAQSSLTRDSLVWDGEAWVASYPFSDLETTRRIVANTYVRVRDGEIVTRTRVEPEEGHVMPAWSKRSAAGVTRLWCGTTFAIVDTVATDGTVVSLSTVYAAAYLCGGVAPTATGFAVLGRALLQTQFMHISDDGTLSEMVPLPLRRGAPEVAVVGLFPDGAGFRALWNEPAEDNVRRTNLMMARIRADGSIDGEPQAVGAATGWSWTTAGMIVQNGNPVVTWNATHSELGGYNSSVRARRMGSAGGACELSDVTFDMDFDAREVAVLPNGEHEVVAFWIDSRQQPYTVSGSHARHQITMQRMGEACPPFSASR